MKKKYFLSLLFALYIPLLVLAACGDSCQAGQFCNPICADTFDLLVVDVANLVTQIAIPIVVIFIIYAGFLFVSARGNETQLTKAKNTFYWTIIGALIVIGANFFARATVHFAQTLGDESGTSDTSGSGSNPAPAAGFKIQRFSGSAWTDFLPQEFGSKALCEEAANQALPGQLISDTQSPTDGALKCIQT